MNRDQLVQVDALAASLGRIKLADARERLSVILDEPKAFEGRDAFTTTRRASALDFNAQLCTRLRERDVRIWGIE